jgi:hypothetical protein
LTFVLGRIVALSAILALGAWVIAAPALADGDPASDVLAAQPVFLPQDANLPTSQQAQLAGLVESAARSGFPIRVAVIASAADLGSVTDLWRQPQSYARFLGQELSLVYRGPLLVVMPNGFGLYGSRAPVALTDIAVPSLGARTGARVSALGARTGARVPALGAGAINGVLRLSRAAGHPLSASAVTAPAASTGFPAGPWIAFAIGCVLVVVAWGASLRARPPGRRGSASLSA